MARSGRSRLGWAATLVGMGVVGLAGCGDLFHTTEWATRCDDAPGTPGCTGGVTSSTSGAGGGSTSSSTTTTTTSGSTSSSSSSTGSTGSGGAGGCSRCSDVFASGEEPGAGDLCPTSLDIHGALSACMCDGPCALSCSGSTRCGGQLPVDECDGCLGMGCAPEVEACMLD